jgi:Tol biopolymer transport system component
VAAKILTVVSLLLVLTLITYDCAIFESFYLRTYSSCSSAGTVAYVFGHPESRSTIYLMDLSDGVERETGHDADDVCWFNDSERLLVEERDYFSIYEITTDSLTPLPVMDGTAASIHASDELVAYEDDCYLTVYSIPEEEVVYRYDFFCLQPDWNPQGNEVVFVNESFGLGVYDYDTGGVRELNVEPEVSYPVWSPDGKCIAYNRPFYSDVFKGTVCVYDLESETEAKLVEGAYPEWTPDGGSLIFAKSGPSRDGRIVSQLYAYELATGNIFQLTHWPEFF